ncbi:gamma-glutamyl-gamma-aminobutyrate hydrolase family protein [Acidihalobacter ferrooxydans]|uniref:gamma-glutamyl-gamma-aminobutyrate hydrolase n=1 Tax=Acidihalobacter ferrooxydans TaxID=1765967 RepID=A0A1P8UD94_9GAMM|nr:gamma-glutamyl-gamma-aminobutyrate hydrolase family protein [Acidihalobacter ferrooxydans]APZ41788.1 gamma-glutamyl-gamma-aminobutyrate hydrolase [Acidihalobacter ferrooxydans]
MSRKPVVGVPADRKMITPHVYHAAGEKYLTALTDVAGVVPMLIPALPDRLPAYAWLDAIDGLLLTGSRSNVEPARYGGPPSAPGTEHDPARDALTLPLLRAALDRAIPVLAICRGFQEFNVAHGGSLHPRVHERPGMLDHREDDTRPLAIQYGPAHTLALTAGGLLQRLVGRDEITVNSLHWQGIDRLGEALRAEAVAPDGLIEAITAPHAPGFNLAVQWHPEWRAAENPVSCAIFEAFGAACREQARRQKPAGPG